VTFPAAALWPYRFVTKVIESLKQKYPSRLSIETNTSVAKVEYTPEAEHPYQIYTSRGVIGASKVVYCTNGYTGYLLPELRGRLFPYRGNMTVQDIKRPVQNPEFSWNFHHKPVYDPKNESIITGSYYMQQNHQSGYFFLGGETQTAQTCLIADDTSYTPVAVENLQKTLIKFFDEQTESRLISAWSGIMGFTADHCPLVGKLPSSITKRAGDGEWIAAGYNGMGMSMCWRAGEAIAKQIHGIDVSDWFPEAFEVSEERLGKSLTLDKSVQSMQYLLHRDTN
jgi:glycine/D-amino acid oxidase-like deaminating enzyme